MTDTSAILAAAKTLATDSNGRTALHRCKTAAEAAAVLKLGADVNAGDKAGATPLQHACYQGNLELAKALLAAGANVNVDSKYSLPSLHAACNYGFFEIAKELLAHGADVNAKKNGLTPLQCCKTEEMRALFAPAPEPAPADKPDFLTALKALIAEYD